MPIDETPIVRKAKGAATTREPAIDGLRAIAVTAVVAYHAGFSGVDGGFVGVDVFFVISGYIITRLLVREFSSTGSIDLPAFYARRVRRLLPAALLCIGVTMILSMFVLQPTMGEPQKFAKSVIYTLGLQANLFFRQLTGGYFGGASNEMPLLHMWSLSVEEQFYLVWPFLLLLGLAKLGVRARIFAILAGTVVSFAISVAILHDSQEDAFYLAPLRAWELGCGVLAAFVVVHGPRWRQQIATFATVAGLVAIIASIATLSERIPFPGYAALLPVLGTVLALLGVYYNEQSALYRVIASRPAVAIGLLSYGWYLWHWPLLALQRINGLGASPLWERCAVALAALGCAAVSYRFVEEPARRFLQTHPWTRWRAIGLGALGSFTMMLLAVAYGIHSRNHIHDVSPDPVMTAALRAPDDTDLVHGCPQASHGDQVVDCALTPPDGAGRVRSLLVMWGDSHAGAWEPFARQMARVNGLDFAAIVHPGCPMAPHVLVITTECESYNDRSLAELRTGRLLNRRVVAVLIATRRPWLWSLYGNQGGAPTPAQLRERNRMIDSALDYTVATLAPTAIDHIIFFAPTPEIRNLSLRCIAKHVESWCAMPRALYLERRAPIMADFAGLQRLSSKVSVIDPAEYLCEHECGPRQGLDVLFFDDSHVSTTAAKKFFAFLTAHAPGSTSLAQGVGTSGASAPHQ